MPLIAREPVSGADIEIARTLFREYAEELGVDLCFQGFEQELAALPGVYSRPQGFIFLASLGEEPVGCIALKPLQHGVCEMKRLFVRPSGRGFGLGRQLAELCVSEARRIGYREMWLDTLGHLTTAIALYHSMGFQDRAPYYDNPLPEVVYMQMAL